MSDVFNKVVVIKGGEYSASETFALDEALMQLYPGTAFFRVGYRFKGVSIPNRMLESEAREIETAAANYGFQVARRPTDGGALMHDLSYPTFSVIIPQSQSVGLFKLMNKAAFENIGGLVVDFLQKMGIEGAEYVYRGNVLVSGRKICGFVGIYEHGKFLFHGVVVNDKIDPALMEAILRDDKAEVMAKTTSLASLWDEMRASGKSPQNLNSEQLAEMMFGAFVENNPLVAQYEVWNALPADVEARMAELQQNAYAAESWTIRGSRPDKGQIRLESRVPCLTTRVAGSTDAQPRTNAGPRDA